MPFLFRLSSLQLHLFSDRATMGKYRALLFLLQLGALACFTFQMVQAIKKFHSKKTIPTTKLINASQLDKQPLITMCENNQWNLLNAWLLGGGLQSAEDFFMGTPIDKAESTTFISWQGLPGNTYNETVQNLFTVHYDSLSYANNSNSNILKYSSVSEIGEGFILPHGRCKLIRPGYGGTIIQGFKYPTQFFITDPDRATRYAIFKDSSEGRAISIFPCKK